MTTASESIHFVAAREIIQTALENRINQTAQTSLANDIICVAVGLRSASLVDQLFLSENDIVRIQSLFHHSPRFSQLDLLSIGQDYVFIIHRDLLLRDIHDYLTGSHMGLQRVFVNIDYHLPQPEIMPNNRYRPLEDYVREVLLPEIETRVSCWAQAEEKFRVLAVPENMSLVTLTGWMLSYPINYIVPKRTFRKSNPQELYHKQGSMKDDYTTAYEEDEDEDEDSGRNCLANQALVVTGVQLEPSEEVEGLGDHLMMSFTYPAKLAERWIDRSVISPEPPCSPFSDDYGQENDEVDSGEDEQFVDASDVEYTESDQDASPHLESKKTIPITNLPKTMTGTCDISNSAEAQLLPPQPQGNAASQPTASSNQAEQKQTAPHGLKSGPSVSPSSLSSSTASYFASPRPLTSFERFQKDYRSLPANNPDIYAAGRAFLHQLHTRFQKQSVWKTWQVGQQTVTLPVVAM